mmetsp:Transcript_21224/g.31568  ORF Transcript_21224/g.31568 Transcript_21224/m.31568 type:complete len:214 (+) Transcript_21224:186-827(+)
MLVNLNHLFILDVLGKPILPNQCALPKNGTCFLPIFQLLMVGGLCLPHLVMVHNEICLKIIQTVVNYHFKNLHLSLPNILLNVGVNIWNDIVKIYLVSVITLPITFVTISEQSQNALQTLLNFFLFKWIFLKKYCIQILLSVDHNDLHYPHILVTEKFLIHLNIQPIKILSIVIFHLLDKQMQHLVNNLQHWTLNVKNKKKKSMHTMKMMILW